MYNKIWIIISILLLLSASCRHKCGEERPPDALSMYVYESGKLINFPYASISIQGLDEVFYSTNQLYVNPGVGQTTFYLIGSGKIDTLTLNYEIEFEKGERCDTYQLTNFKAGHPTSFDSITVSDYNVEVYF